MGVFALRPVVLVVDDGAANRELIRMYLSTIDCEVRLAADGVAALEMIEREPPDLVLLDVRMPRMEDRKSTRLNSSHRCSSYAVFCLNCTDTTSVYTLSLHDALPIFCAEACRSRRRRWRGQS